MPSIHLLGHIVSIAVIAVLVKQLMQVQLQLNRLLANEANTNSEEDITSVTNVPALDVTQSDKSEMIANGQVPSTGGFSHSSVWCLGKDNNICHFKNLCYNSAAEEFVMFLGNASVFENVQLQTGSVLVDMSSVKGHNAQQIYITSLPFHKIEEFSIRWINRTSVIFNRFKPDNLMHVLHDDILPLHHTLKTITMNNSNLEMYNVQIVYNDAWEWGEFGDFYQLFSKETSLLKESLLHDDGLTCFSDVYLGVSRTTVWYDYGFTQPQGPVTPTATSAYHIHSTVQYIATHLTGENHFWMPADDYIILLTREENRKILNAMELIVEITTKIGMKVINLNFESYSLKDLVNFVQTSKGLIGMHGSLLGLAIFLTPGSIMVELFPYAINPNNYTPYKTLANLPGMGLIYKSWVNNNIADTAGHPNREPELGGLKHLPENERDMILLQTDVPSHLCCSDPSWLFHIYQDTVVDIPAVISLINLSLSELKEKEVDQSYSGFGPLNFHPSQVKNITCVLSKLESGNFILSIKWIEPWTVQLIPHSGAHFEILVQQTEPSSIHHYKSHSTTFTVETEEHVEYYVWVRCIIDHDRIGPYGDAVLCMEKEDLPY